MDELTDYCFSPLNPINNRGHDESVNSSGVDVSLFSPKHFNVFGAKTKGEGTPTVVHQNTFSRSIKMAYHRWYKPEEVGKALLEEDAIPVSCWGCEKKLFASAREGEAAGHCPYCDALTLLPYDDAMKVIG